MDGVIPAIDRRSDGFSCRISGNEARRQLKVSVGVVVMLAIGIVSAAFTVGAHPISAKRDIVSVTTPSTQHAESVVGGAKAL